MPNRFRLVLRSIVTAALALGVTLVGAGGATGCGRSDLVDYIVPPTDGGTDAGDGSNDVSDDFIADDGPPDGAFCDAFTCPDGCCDGNGLCEMGLAVSSCGFGGDACQNCLAEGFNICDPASRQCSIKMPGCGPTNCPGCCEGDFCTGGNSSTACGGGGQSCTDCASSNLICQATASARSRRAAPGRAPAAASAISASRESCRQRADSAASSASIARPSGRPANPRAIRVASAQRSKHAVRPTARGCCEGRKILRGSGNNPTECGSFGQQCQNCQAFGEACVAGGMGSFCA